jgi:hypothetical protein
VAAVAVVAIVALVVVVVRRRRSQTSFNKAAPTRAAVAFDNPICMALGLVVL